MPSAMVLYLGFDGGGTKTECCAVDATGRLVGHGLAAASNPLRVGYAAAIQALDASAAEALRAADAGHDDVRGVCAALAGAGRASVVARMHEEAAKLWPQASIRVITDADAALAAAVGTGPGIVLIAGTGSMALGRNARGMLARAGGYGPWIGDFGSAYDIGRRSALAAARAGDLAAPATSLRQLIVAALGCADWDEVIEAIAAAPDDVLPRLFPTAIAAAESGDEVAGLILRDAALELSKLAVTVVGVLGMRDDEFRLARTGGVFDHTPLVDRRVDELLKRAASRARIEPLRTPVALAAACLAAGASLC
jgi:glucosamine kinase